MGVGYPIAEVSYCSRPTSSGTVMDISWSKRPARRNAESSESGLFVAPITTTGRFPVFSQDNSRQSTVASQSVWIRQRAGSLTVHTCQKLSNDSALHLTLCALSLGCNSIDLIDK